MAQRTTRGAAWLIASRLCARSIDFVLLLILGRMLGPAEFGLVAIAMTLILIVEAILELPLIQVLIQIAEPEPAYYDTAFTLAAMRGASVMLMLCLAAWPFAQFYHDSRLFPLICLLSLAPAARGLGSPMMASFNRVINFQRDFVLEVIGKIVAFGVAAIIAWTTRSYWSLAAATVMAPLAGTAISYVLAPYRPHLSLAKWHDFKAFLGWATASQILTAIYWQCDRLLLGRLVTKSLLGQFSMANDLSGLPLQALIIPLLRPLTAAFALVRHDRERLCQAYLKVTGTIFMVGVPIMVCLSASAAPAVRLVLGERWNSAIPILQGLSLSMIPSLFLPPMQSLAMALDRTDIGFRQAVFEFAIKIPSVLAAAILWNIEGVIVARIVTAILAAGMTMQIVRSTIGISFKRQILAPWRSLVSGAASFAALAPLQSALAGLHDPSTELAGLVISGIIGMVTYGVSLFVLWTFSGRPNTVDAQIFVRLRRVMVVRRPGRGAIRA